MSSEFRGIVSGVLSGDSLIVRLVNQPVQVVCLEHLIAPKLGRPDGKFRDEEHGYNAWAYLRDLCIGKRVLITSSHATHQTRSHPAFSREPLPVIFARVKLYDTDEDIGEVMCSSGWVKMRDARQGNNAQDNQYIDTLKNAQEDAEANHRGIWSEEPGLIRSFPVPCDPEEILQRRVFEVNIDQIKSVNSFSVFVLPNHENIIITLPGIRPVKFSSDELHNKIRDQSRNKFLHRRVKVWICKKNEYPSEIPSFIGCFLDERLDLAVADSIAKGYAVLNKKNLEYAPNPDLYIKKQMLAQKNQAGFWNGTEYQAPQIPIQKMNGIVTSVKGSNSFYVIVDGQRKNVILNNVKVPRFNPMSFCESCGFEASEFLRTTYNKKIVTIEIDGIYEDRIYATILHKGISINEELCRRGLAEYEAEYGRPSSRLQEIKMAEEMAKKEKIGIWAEEKPEPVKITDFTRNKDLTEQVQYLQEQKNVKCVITHVFTSNRFSVFIPEKKWIIPVSLNGIASISNQDKFGYESKMFCLDNYLQSEVEIEIVSCDDYAYIWVIMRLCDEAKTNVAVKILENGFSEIKNKYGSQEEIPQEYINAQALAKTTLKGIWSDRTRHSFDIINGMSYCVTVKEVWSPTHYSVQHRGPDMEKIDELLKQETEQFADIPLKNDCLVYRNNGNSFRVRIESVFVEKNIANVKLIDIDKDMAVPLKDLYALPQELYNIPPQGRSIRQAGITYGEHEDNERKAHIETIKEIVVDKALYMFLVSNDGNSPYVVLLDNDDLTNGVCLATALLQSKMVSFEECEYPQELTNVFNQLKAFS